MLGSCMQTFVCHYWNKALAPGMRQGPLSTHAFTVYGTVFTLPSAPNVSAYYLYKTECLFHLSVLGP